MRDALFVVNCCEICGLTVHSWLRFPLSGEDSLFPHLPAPCLRRLHAPLPRVHTEVIRPPPRTFDSRFYSHDSAVISVPLAQVRHQLASHLPRRVGLHTQRHPSRHPPHPGHRLPHRLLQPGRRHLLSSLSPPWLPSLLITPLLSFSLIASFCSLLPTLPPDDASLLQIDVLLDEKVLIGSTHPSSARSALETLRPLACSTLADLVHHVRGGEHSRRRIVRTHPVASSSRTAEPCEHSPAPQLRVELC